MAIQILVGADPELFVRNPNSKDFVSAYGLIEGNKKKPQPVPYGAVQVDGMALEFNINPAATGEEFLNNINQVRKQLESMVPGYNVVVEPVADFSQGYLDAQPDEAKALGCDPDFDAWSGLANVAPDQSLPFRTASGHVHIGWTSDKDPNDPDHFQDCREVAMQLDYYLGAPSLLWDKDNRRRKLYGRAGAFRPKPYGCEYRVLSNAWLTSDTLTRYVYDATVKGVTDLANGIRMIDYHGCEAANIINGNDVGWFERIQFGTDFPLPKVA